MYTCVAENPFVVVPSPKSHTVLSGEYVRLEVPVTANLKVVNLFVYPDNVSLVPSPCPVLWLALSPPVTEKGTSDSVWIAIIKIQLLQV